MRKLLLLAILFFQVGWSQETFTRKDSLFGGLRPERTCFDVLRYDLNITINPKEKSIVGCNEISFKVVENSARIQLDLFANMQIDSIICNSKKVKYSREFNAVFLAFETPLAKDSHQKIYFYYSGYPLVAKNAPWDGGLVCKKDSNGKDWLGIAVQGTGASLWYPCKDSQTDEPDLGATIKVAVPNGLMNVSNGRLVGSEDLKNGYTRWDWEIKNPINSYNITFNVGDYVYFGEQYQGLDLAYYVLRENEAKAKRQFTQVKPMIDCFQSKFGPYPFAEDSYKLVETPYLGMEHQSAVAYGNKYHNGYLGSDLSATGKGLLFDFIIVHESGHEWFGNCITSKDVADMWIHEGFTCYAESVYLECQYGSEAAEQYINGLKRNIRNDKPIIGNYGVGNEGSSDMYYKGALMINTIRNTINNDEKWWQIILKFATTFRHQIIDNQDVLQFFNTESGLDLTPIFNQYLRYTSIPTFEYRIKKNCLDYRWKTDVPDFLMPIDLQLKGKSMRIYPSNQWQSIKVKSLKDTDLKVATNRFLVNQRNTSN